MVRHPVSSTPGIRFLPPMGEKPIGNDLPTDRAALRCSAMVAQAWFLVSATLLVVSGAAKLMDAAPTAGALKAAHLPHSSAAGVSPA